MDAAVSRNVSTSPLLGSAAEREARVSLAAQYVGSALEGTPLRLEPHSAVEATAVRVLVKGGYWRCCVRLLVVVLVGAAPWTVDDARSGLKGSKRTARRVVTACCASLLVDCAVQTWIFRREWLRQGWHQIRLAALVVTLANTQTGCFASLTGVPAVVVVAEFGLLRRTIASMARMVPTVAPVVALFAGTVLGYSHLGVLVWKECYEDESLDVEFFGAFDTVSRAAWTLFVLSTTENYPFVMYPALECSRSFAVPLAVGYFVSYVFIVVYILVSVLLAAFYEAWKHEHEKSSERERVRHYHALLTAFDVLAGDQGLSRDDWDALALELRPNSTHEDRVAAFDVIGGGADTVDSERFVLRCRAAFDSNLADDGAFSPRRRDRASLRFSWRDEPRDDSRRRLFESNATCGVLHVLVTLYVVCEAASENARAAYTRHDLDALTNCVLAIFACEQLARPRALAAHRVLDATLVAIAIICRWLVLPLGGSVFDARHVASACIAARYLTLSQRTRAVIVAIARVWRILGLFAVVFALAIYVYAAVAVELCAGILPGREHWLYDQDDDFVSDHQDDVRDRGVLDNRVVFNSIAQAWENLLRIAVTNNWQDLVNAYVFSSPARNNATSFRRTAIGAFLFSFYVLLVWFGTNVMVALVIDALLSDDDHQNVADDRGPLRRAGSSSSIIAPVSSDDERPSSPSSPTGLDAFFTHSTDELVLSARAADNLRRKRQRTQRALPEQVAVATRARTASDRWSALRTVVFAANRFSSGAATRV